MTIHSRLAGTVFLLALFPFLTPSAAVAEEDTTSGSTFEKASEIIGAHCLECHGPTEKAGGLLLTSAESLARGGESGPVIEGASTDASLLFAHIESGEMPPPEKGVPRPLSAAELKSMQRWIEAGAPWPEDVTLDLYDRTTAKRGGRDWWSLQPIKAVAPPDVTTEYAPDTSNAVDSFILEKLSQRSLTLAPRADRRTLIHRLHFDLLGTPPSFEEVAEFETDERPDAYTRLVDRLLSRPEFGERWSRYWLDLARFAETSGYERDQEKPNAWRYRDWVVKSLNTDLPYDQFVLRQLAGDELDGADQNTWAGTGFLRLGTWNDEPNDPNEYKYERLEDMVHTTSSAFLGLTVKCARCHDHKFDPIPQVDYYRMASAFWAGYVEAGDRAHLGGPPAEKVPFDVLAWTDRSASPPPLHRLHKGDPKRPAEVVAPDHLTIVTHLRPTFNPPSDAGSTTGRRRQLAEWIVHEQNPLAARVIVNRLWLHHFGQGIVRSPNNFGFRGDLPTHPQLLDYLATELVSGGWSLKRIHRLLLNSSTYQQSADHPEHETYSESDSSNRFLWHMPRRRRDAESIRDALLTVSDTLDRRVGGPSFRPSISPDALEGLSRKTAAWSASPEQEQYRRSLYIYTKRGLLYPFLTAFDFSDTTLPCGKREQSTVAPQALLLLNAPLVHKFSQQLSVRIENETAGAADQVRRAWRYVLQRDPTEHEARLAIAHLNRQRTTFADRQNATNGHSDKSAVAKTVAKNSPMPEGLVLHLDAGRGVETDDVQRVVRWLDQSGKDHHATMSDPARRPLLQKAPSLEQSKTPPKTSVRFAPPQFMHIAGQVITNQQFSIIAVATDEGKPGHREIFSNWDGSAGNATTSIFLGMTAEAAIRFSDDFSGVGNIQDREQTFILSAIQADTNATLRQNGRSLAQLGRRLSARNLKTPYVIGQQGDIQGEYWQGTLSELLVFDRALKEQELAAVERRLAKGYGIDWNPTLTAVPVRTPSQLALQSLCHVLLNSSEFLYID